MRFRSRGRLVTGLGASMLGAAASLLLTASPAATPSREVIATGVLRPLQLALDAGTLVVLSPGPHGDSAAQIQRVDLSAELPVDLSREPSIRIPFATSRMASLGSLAIDPSSRDMFLGEENGRAIHRLTRDERLALYATGLQRLPGGSALAFDSVGRLVILDYADPLLSSEHERAPPGLEEMRAEDYRGPLVLRLTPDPTLPLPRRLGQAAPLFPRVWGGKAGGGLLPRLIAVTPVATGELILLSSSGGLYRLSPEGTLTLSAQLPQGFYNRINMVAGPNGSVVVSGGFHVPRIFKITAEGAVSVIADELGDPEGIALDAGGRLYVAESSLHRIVRLRAFEHGGG